MKCEFCNSDTNQIIVRKQHWLQGKLYIVENVAVEVCPECGERYYHATILDKFDKLINSDHQVKETMSVEILTV